MLYVFSFVACTSLYCIVVTFCALAWKNGFAAGMPEFSG